MTERRQADTLFYTVLMVLFIVMVLWKHYVGPDKPVMASRLGIFLRNDCGTYDRWVTFDLLHMPNGLFGIPSDACKQPKSK